MRKQLKIKIGDYNWTILFVNKEDERIKKCDGIALYNNQQILIRDDLNEITTFAVIRHEIVHALLCTQGRWMQKKFDVEEVCEFIAFRYPELDKLCKTIEKQLFATDINKEEK